MTIRLVGKDQTSQVLDALQEVFKLTVYPYLIVDQRNALLTHIGHLYKLPGFDTKVDIGADPVSGTTHIVIDITLQAQESVKQ